MQSDWVVYLQKVDYHCGSVIKGSMSIFSRLNVGGC